MDTEELLEQTKESETVDDALSYIEDNTDFLSIKKKSDISTGETVSAQYVVFDQSQDYEVDIYSTEDDFSTEIMEASF